MTAFILAEALLEKLGGDSLAEMLPRFKALPGANLNDLHISADKNIYWPDDEESV